MAPHQENGTVCRLAARCTEMWRAKKKCRGGRFIHAPVDVYVPLALSDKDRDNRVQWSRPSSPADPYTEQGHRKDESVNFFGDIVDQMLSPFWGDCIIKADDDWRNSKPAV